MIASYHKEFKDMIRRLNTDALTPTPNDDMVSWQFVGFAAGLAFALNTLEIAKEADLNLRKEWLSISGPGGLYQPGIMADRMMQIIKKLRGGNGYDGL